MPLDLTLASTLSVDMTLTGENGTVTIADATDSLALDLAPILRGAKGDSGEGVAAGGTASQILAKASSANFDTHWIDNTSSTDLGYVPSPSDGAVTSSSGDDATLPAVDGTNAGLMLPAHLASLSTAASNITSLSTSTSSGIDSLSSSASTGLSAGVSGLTSLSTSTSSGISSLSSSTSTGLSTLTSSVTSLSTSTSSGIDSLSSSTSAGLSTVTSSVISLSTSASTGLSTVTSSVTSLSSSTSSGINSLSASTSTGLSTVTSSIASLSTSTSSGINSLSTSASTGLSTATSGMVSLSTSTSAGINSLSSSTSSGINSLSTALSTTNSNLTSLSTSTSTGVNSLSTVVSGLNIFKTVAVSGQSDVVADSQTDTLTLAAGSNVTITTDASTDTVTIAASSGGGISSSTFSGLPAASGNSGVIYLVTDVGASPGSLMISNGSRWKALSGRIRLTTLVTPVTGLTNSEAISLQALMPAGLMNAGDEIEVTVAVDKSGTTDSANIQFRVGTAGTTGDTALLASANNMIGAATRTVAGFFIFKLASATTMQRIGLSQLGIYTGAAGATPAAVTITSAASNALYFSVSLVSSSTNNTVGIQVCHIDLVTP